MAAGEMLEVEVGISPPLVAQSDEARRRSS